MKKLLVSSLFVLSTLPIAAQQKDTPVVGDEIVVTASALAEPVEQTPASVTIVTREDIEDRVARDVADVLREVPGISISRTGSEGRATSLFTRGSNSTHTLVLWNGIELTNPYFAGYDWGRFSTVGVEQVEVVRGPYSALYGSDAVAGVVNIITAPKKSELRAAFETGSKGLRNGDVVASYVNGGSLVSASYETREDDGFAANDDFNQKSANLLLRWTSSNHFSIGLAARHTDYDLGLPFNLNFDSSAIVPSPNRRQNGTERQVAVPISQKIGRFSWEATVSESRRSDEFSDPDDPFGFVASTTESSARRARLSTTTETPIGTIVAGGEYERAEVDDVSNFGASLENNRRKETSFFVEDRLSREVGDASRFELALGARHDRYDTFGSETSPRVAVAFVTGANKFRAAYGQSFRAPSVGELYFPFSGNLALEPERGRSIELGYDLSLGDGGQFSVTAFRGRYTNLIVFDNATYAFGNVGRADSQGVETSYERKLPGGVSSGFSYTFLDTDQDKTGNPLLRRPKHSGSVHVGYRSRNLETNTVVRYTGAREDVLPVAPFSRTTSKSNTVIDLNFQYHLGQFTPYVKIENATNEKYEEVLGYPSPTRRTIFGVRYTM